MNEHHQSLENWLLGRSYSLLDFSIDGSFLTIGKEQAIFYIVPEKEKTILRENFVLAIDDSDIDVITGSHITDIYGLVYEFGGCWYWHEDGTTDFELKPFENLFTTIDSKLNEYPFLGIHGKYEICNGSRSYQEWCDRAKFLGYNALGICEKQTLAGVLSFQIDCLKNDIKPIIGEEVLLDNNAWIKLYVIDDIGWKNLLMINKLMNVDRIDLGHRRHITVNELLQNSKGLFCILNKDFPFTDSILIDSLKSCFDDRIYYQFDPSAYESQSYDEKLLKNIEHYYREYAQHIPACFCDDAFYIHSTDFEIKPVLNKIGKLPTQPFSKMQYMKSPKEVGDNIKLIMKDEQEAQDTIDFIFDNAVFIVKQCKFLIDVNSISLPKFEMDGAFSQRFRSNKDLFDFLIKQGFKEKFSHLSDEQQTIRKDRLKKEIEVLEKSNIIDYFLILWDIVRWCEEKNILIGIGRGSAAGALVSYLLGIVKIDPIEYGLLFERFLNEARLQSELPDIDTDFPGISRDDVKDYIRDKYGYEYVCSIGTYVNMKLKLAFTDISREYGVNFFTIKQVTKYIRKDFIDGNFSDFVQCACNEYSLREFMRTKPDIANLVSLCVGQPKTSSVHAAAMIVVPKEKNGEPMNIFNWLPVKLINNKLVSEWEGKQIEKAGFLKEDILGLKQLDKFTRIIQLINDHYNKQINIYSLPLDDEKVYEFFGKGYNEDVFQFSGDGMKGFCKVLKPDRIEDIIAANALYRPGPMDSNAHLEYAELKNGRMIPKYDFLLEDITKETYGLYVYQEQIMLAFQKITDADLNSADKFRKIITKTKKGIINEDVEKYKNMFIDSYINKGLDIDNATIIWDKLVAFAKYGFNKSHAASYGIMAYISQWFKVNYPLEFWTASLEFADDDKIPPLIEEISTIDAVSISHPDVNKSTDKFEYDNNENFIYWSLISISNLGPAAYNKIIKERDENGPFESLDNFYSRVKVNKTILLHLVISGAFDKIENVDEPHKRLYLLKTCQSYYKYDLDETWKDEAALFKNYFWQIKQKELIGFGFINFQKLCDSKDIEYKPSSYILDDGNVEKDIDFIGLCVGIRPLKTKNNDSFVEIICDCNANTISLVLWPSTYRSFEDEIKGSVNKIILARSVKIKFNDYKNSNSLYSTNSTKIEIL